MRKKAAQFKSPSCCCCYFCIVSVLHKRVAAATKLHHTPRMLLLRRNHAILIFWMLPRVLRGTIGEGCGLAGGWGDCVLWLLLCVRCGSRLAITLAWGGALKLAIFYIHYAWRGGVWGGGTATTRGTAAEQHERCAETATRRLVVVLLLLAGCDSNHTAPEKMTDIFRQRAYRR